MNLVCIVEIWCNGPNGSVIVTNVLNLETECCSIKLTETAVLVISEPVMSVVVSLNLIDLEIWLWLASIGLLVPIPDSPNVSISIGVKLIWVAGVSFTFILVKVGVSITKGFSSYELLIVRLTLPEII